MKIQNMSIFAVVLLFFSVDVFAKKVAIDTSKSVVRWFGRKVAGEHNGTVKVKSGHIEYSKNGQSAKGEFIIDMNSISNDDIESPKYKAKLEGHLKSNDFFNVSKFPTAKFVIKEMKVKNKAKGEWSVKGMLTIKDKTHEISFPAKVATAGKNPIQTATADFKIDRLKWDIKYNSGKVFDVKKLGDKMIYDDIQFKLLIATTGPKS